MSRVRDGSTFSFTQATAGANASLTVDGVPISSASNTVTGAISGVTLTLLGAAPAVPVDLTVASNAAQVSTAINQFVTDYNTAIGLVNAQFTIGSTGTEGVLGSDSTISNLQSTMEQALNYHGYARNRNHDHSVNPQRLGHHPWALTARSASIHLP